ncbi:MAG: hypothetical protein L3J79_12125 [Candidatus Marinimicrobia bacterium]|nr:hypothetical protein [Candidatus Neomarinimicrobiota bacterium]
MTIVDLNRALIGLFLLAVSAAVVMAFWREPISSESASQQLPLRILFNKGAPAEWWDLQISAENPFSRDGKPWKFEYAAAKQKTTKDSIKAAPGQLKDINLEGVNGFVKLPGLTALMTKDGVIREGSLFQGATIKSLQPGEVVFVSEEHDDEVTRELTTGRTPLDKIHIQGFPRYLQ